MPNVLRHKWVFLIAVLIVFIMSLGLFFVIDKEFMPKIDQREFIMKVTMLSGTKLDVTDSVVKKIEKVLLSTEETEGVAINIGSSRKKDYAQGLETMGSHQSQIIVNLKKSKKFAPTSEVIEKLKVRLDKLNLEGAAIEYILQESIFKTALQGSAPVVIEVKGKDLKKIEDISKHVKDGLADIEGIYGIRTSLTQPSPETKVNIIKDKAALYNLSTGSIAQAAHTAIKGVVATKFKEEGREIDVRVRLRKEGRSRLSQVRNILIHSPLDIEVPLSEVAYITQGVGPSEIKRLDQQRAVLVTANIKDRALDKVIADINDLLGRIEAEKIGSSKGLSEAEKDLTMSLSGESQQMKESFDSLKFALFLSILLVYMIMAAQFESLWQPFVIMFTVPLSLVGVFAILFLTHTPISVVVILGIIILGGIVVNNGIILIDSINKMRANGVDLVESVIESGKTRLRPIFMTTMTTVLGLFPLALGLSEGSALQSPMAITVMGGLMVSTVLTLFVIPCVYTIVAGIIEKKAVLKPAPVSLPVAAPAAPPAPVVQEKKKVIELPPPPAPESKPEPEPEPKAEPPSKPPAPQKLNRRQEELVEHLKKAGRITRKEYSELFKISVPTAARDLKELTNKGVLIARGPLGPGRWYELKS